MESKLFEVLDRATCMVVMATKLTSNEYRERGLLQHIGFRFGHERILLTDILTGRTSFDPYEWINSRTLKAVHEYLLVKFDDLKSGVVIDVEYILDEVFLPKYSDVFNRKDFVYEV